MARENGKAEARGLLLQMDMHAWATLCVLHQDSIRSVDMIE